MVVVEVVLLILGYEIVVWSRLIEFRGFLGGHGHGAVGVWDVWCRHRAC